MERRFALLAAGAAAACLPAAAPAQVIDDFEAGAFGLSCTFDYCSDSQYIGSHGIDPTRGVTILGNGETPITATLNTTPYDDHLVVYGYDPTLWLYYDPPGTVDFTGGGTWNFMLLDMTVTSGTQFELGVTLGNGFSHIGTTPVTLNGITALGWDDFGPLTSQDLQDVDRFHVYLSNQNWFGPVTFDIEDIRFGRGLFTYAAWDNIIGSLQWINGAGDEAYWEVYSDTSQPDYEHHLLPLTIWGSNPTIRVEAFDSGGDIGNPGPFSGTATFWDDPGRPYSTTSFEMNHALYGSGRRPIMKSPPIVVYQDSASVAYEYVLETVEWAGGARHGNIVERVTMDVMPGQPLRIDNFSVVQNGTDPPDYTVSYRLTPYGTVDIAQALVSTQIVSDWAQGKAATAAVTVADAEAGAALTARPSVTAGRTVLELARPREKPGDILVLDVTGRRVARLPVAAGATSAAWDGRDTGGARLPAGVYFAVLPDPAERIVARVVLVR